MAQACVVSGGIIGGVVAAILLLVGIGAYMWSNRKDSSSEDDDFRNRGETIEMMENHSHVSENQQQI